jgi:hypothetical protein
MLAQLATVHGSIHDKGGSVIGIAPAPADQAAHLVNESIPFKLFVDPNQLVGARIGMGKQSLTHFVFSVPAWWRYLRAFFSGHWQRRITGRYSNVPGVCVVDANGNVSYTHRGSGLGDYPPLDTVLAELDTTLTT